MKKIGIIGAGKLGLALAKLALDAGYDVGISSSRPAQAIELTVEVLAPGAKAYTTTELIEQFSTIILALPLSRFLALPDSILTQFKEKIVLDAMNFWWEIDGKDQEAHYRNSSVTVQNKLPEAFVVKAFNHMGYHDLAAEATTKEHKKAIVYATDHPHIVPEIEELIKQLGFDPYALATLEQGVMLEPGSPLFGANESKAVLDVMIRQMEHKTVD